MGFQVLQSDLRVLYEDNHVIAVFKPGRVPVQSDISGDSSLMDLVKEYLKEKYQKPGNVFLGLVHRLDRPVSGIVVFAKTSKAASRLSESFRSRVTQKTYLAKVEGNLKGRGKLVHHLLSREGQPVVIKKEPFEGSKEAILEYKVTGPSIVEVQLHTGRKHQIRAQLAFIGHPILGDKKYGSSERYREGEIALVASRLVVPHPTKEEEIRLELASQAW